MVTEIRILKVRLKVSSRTSGNACLGEKSSSSPAGSYCLLISRSRVSTSPQILNPTLNLRVSMSLYREIAEWKAKVGPT